MEVPFLGGDNFSYDPTAYIEHLAEHFERGEMTIREALEAATLVSTGRSIDLTREYQVVLIALGMEELARRFVAISLVMAKVGMGMAIGIDPNIVWTADDLTDAERTAMDIASMSCLRRAGVEADIRDGRLHIEPPENVGDEDIIDAFIRELNDLPEEDPTRKGWDKWTK